MTMTPLPLRALTLPLALGLASCAGPGPQRSRPPTPVVVNIDFGANADSSGHKAPTTLGDRSNTAYVFWPEGGARTVWAEFDVEIPVTGIYRAEIIHVFAQGTLWLEDCAHNSDARSLDLTGPIEIDHTIGVSGSAQPPFSPSDGLHLESGAHRMRLHCSTPELIAHGVRFTLTHGAPEVNEPLDQSLDQTQR